MDTTIDLDQTPQPNHLESYRSCIADDVQYLLAAIDVDFPELNAYDRQRVLPLYSFLRDWLAGRV